MSRPTWFSPALADAAQRMCTLSYEPLSAQRSALSPWQVDQLPDGSAFFTRTGDTRWLVFRGTSCLADIVTDLKVHPMEVSPLCPGVGHSGFVKRARSAPPVPHETTTILVVTGHSLGAAAAQAWTVHRLQQCGGERVYCLSFAAPFLVDEALRSNLQLRCQTDAFVSLVNPGDPVPVLPRIVYPYFSPAGHLGILCGSGNVRWISDLREQTRAVQVRTERLEADLGDAELQSLRKAMDGARRYGPDVAAPQTWPRLVEKWLKCHSLSSYDHSVMSGESIFETYGLPARRCHVVPPLPPSSLASAAAQQSDDAFEGESLSRLREWKGRGAQMLTQLSAIKSNRSTHFSPDMLGLVMHVDNPRDECRQLFYSLMDGELKLETAVATTNDIEMPRAPHALRLRITNASPFSVSCMIPAGTVFEQPKWTMFQNVASQFSENVHVPANETVEVVIPGLCMNEQYDCPTHDNVNITPFAVQCTGALTDQVALWNHMSEVLSFRRGEELFRSHTEAPRSRTEPFIGAPRSRSEHPCSLA